VIGLLVFTMSFVGGVRLKHIAVATVPFGLVAACLVWFVPYRRERFLAFLDPWQHAQTSGHQLVQSFLAFGAGGVWGVGLGAGKQKLHYLPEAHTDFILSIWAEETGLVGVTVVLALFAVLVWRGYSIAVRQRDPYRRLLAMGITTWLALQASLNSLVVMGCLPTKGLPFPFLSYGGTGMVVTLTTVGILAGLGRKERPA
jgi:cell division protein FtsW